MHPIAPALDRIGLRSKSRAYTIPAIAFWRISQLLKLIALALCTATACTAMAQGKPSKTPSPDGPSLKETVEFIERRAPDFGNFSIKITSTEGYPVSASVKLSIKGQDGALRTIEESSKTTDRSKSSYRETMIFDTVRLNTTAKLGDLRAVARVKVFTDPNFCQLEYECEQAECIEFEEITEFGSVPSNMPPKQVYSKKGRRSSNSLNLQSAEDCNRFKAALEHLIQLSGGSAKKDAF